MHDQIRAQLNWATQIGRSEGGIDHHRNTGCVGNFGDRRNVQDLHTRIAHHLAEDQLGIVLNGRSKGGQTTWENVVAACSPCNLRKGNLTPQQARMFPRQLPFAPTVHQLHRNGRLFPPNYLHDSWLDYLYWELF